MTRRLISSGMRAIAGAQSGFDVSHADAEFRTHQCRRHRRVDVPVDENEIWLALQ